jgi:hypothetical protein
VRKPFYDTANGGPVKKMIVVSDSNFIAGFGGANCCKYYRVAQKLMLRLLLQHIRSKTVTTVWWAIRVDVLE